MRYKLPGESDSTLITAPILKKDIYASVEDAPRDARFAAAVAAFGHKMAKSAYTNEFSYEDIVELALDARGRDRYGYRAEFIELVDTARTISKRERS